MYAFAHTNKSHPKIYCVFVLVYRNSIFEEENKYCGAKGGPKSTLFGRIDLEPLYFNVNIVCAIFFGKYIFL